MRPRNQNYQNGNIMKEKTYCIKFGLLVLGFLLVAATVFAQTDRYKLQPTDVLSITVHDQPDLSTKIRITTDGYISFPLLGKVYTKGMTVQGLEKRLKDLLEKDYLVTAQVIVFIEEYHPRQISVIGEVYKPDKYDMPDERDLTLLEAIAMAGGFTQDADVDKTMIMREKDSKKETINVRVKEITKKGDKDKDIVLEPGDIIIVPESFF